jgi:hypothetical protein
MLSQLLLNLRLEAGIDGKEEPPSDETSSIGEFHRHDDLVLENRELRKQLHLANTQSTFASSEDLILRVDEVVAENHFLKSFVAQQGAQLKEKERREREQERAILEFEAELVELLPMKLQLMEIKNKYSDAMYALKTASARVTKLEHDKDELTAFKVEALGLREKLTAYEAMALQCDKYATDIKKLQSDIDKYELRAMEGAAEVLTYERKCHSLQRELARVDLHGMFDLRQENAVLRNKLQLRDEALQTILSSHTDKRLIQSALRGEVLVDLSEEEAGFDDGCDDGNGLGDDSADGRGCVSILHLFGGKSDHQLTKGAHRHARAKSDQSTPQTRRK